MSIFSSREIVAASFITIVIIFAVSHKSIRPSVVSVIRAALSKQIVFPFLLMIAYAGLLTFLFSRSSFWKWYYLKDIIIWVLFVGTPICFNAALKDREAYYFRHIITDNIKLAVFVEFLISTFTFPILGEFVLQFILLFLGVLQAYAGTKEEYASTKKFVDWLLAIIGLFVLAYSLIEAVKTYADLNSIDLFVSFITPLVFSVLYLPVAYLLAVYSKYQLLFIRMRFKESKDYEAQKTHRKKALKACGLSLKKIDLFQKNVVPKMYPRLEEHDFQRLIIDFMNSQ